MLDYIQWINELIEVFGEVYHFMYPNQIVNNHLDFFYDHHHFYPEVGNYIVDFINNPSFSYEKFGILLNKKINRNLLIK